MNKKYKLIIISGLLSFSTMSQAENIKTFVDAGGQEISCVIDNSGSHCKNTQGEIVICSNSDSGYICSSEEE